jgi:uncharacterized membrane protein
MRPPRWDWHGIVAVILAGGVAVTLILELVNIILRDGHVTEVEATILSTAFGAMIGAVATYLGGKDEHRFHTHEDVTELMKRAHEEAERKDEHD